jgi:cell division protein FtsA
MDGLKRQDRKLAEQRFEEKVADAEAEEHIEEPEINEPPKKERRSFLDKLTDRVKDFLENAE